MEKLSKKQIKRIEKLEWKVSDCGDYYELENYSPAGENLVETLYKNESLKEQAYALYEDFDEDEHVEMWIEARKSGVSGVPSISALVHDAEQIAKMYEDLAIAIAQVA